METFAQRTHEDMKPVLMKPDATGLEVYYHMIKSPNNPNLTIWEAGTVGGEFIKTLGHYHVGNLAETYTVLEGTALFLLQKRKVDGKGKPIDSEIEEFRVVKLHRGEKIEIGKEWGHVICNIGKSWLITIDTPLQTEGKADYDPIKKLHGFAYYVVEENGGMELVKNTNYKYVPNVEIASSFYSSQ